MPLRAALIFCLGPLASEFIALHSMQDIKWCSLRLSTGMDVLVEVEVLLRWHGMAWQGMMATGSVGRGDPEQQPCKRRRESS